MRNFLYKKLLKGHPLTTDGWHYDGRFHVTPNRNYTFGFGFSIGKGFLRQGISIYVPWFCFTFYIHSKQKSWEIWDRNYPATDRG